MSRAISAKPNSTLVRAFGYPDDQVTAYETISVTIYASGTRRASHGRLDTASNRMTFTQLSDPCRGDCEYGSEVSHMLSNAAYERLQEVLDQGTLF